MTDTEKLAGRICAGDRRALARAITLVESTRADHRQAAENLLATLAGRTEDALRIGLSGTPGVGKSTFLETLGCRLTDAGTRVAVLAVDPTSARSGGSILGDKTRMERLSRAPGAFIRPSPAGDTLGGVARRTREVAALCSAAGDELQGVKRGIMEIADLILVNKADGNLMDAATRTCADYAGALRLMRRRSGDAADLPRAMLVSAATGKGIDEAWATVEAAISARRASGYFERQREGQALDWYRQELTDGLLAQLRTAQAKALVDAGADQIRAGTTSPVAAAREVLDALKIPGAGGAERA